MSGTEPHPYAAALERALADPETRSRLARALADELRASARSRPWRPFLAGLASGAVAVFGFLLPSFQEQWTLYKTRSAVERYADIGRKLMAQGHYLPAEQAYTRALELAGGQRIDLLQAQLRAHVERVNDDEQWPGATPDDVSESDFVYLLEFQDEPAQARDRASTLSAYGAYLAGQKRMADAESRLREAVELDADNVSAHVNLGNLGNLLRDLDQPQQAEPEYRKALALSPDESSAHYDLGLLLLESGRAAEAEAEFRAYLNLEPGNHDGQRQLALSLRALGRAAHEPSSQPVARDSSGAAPHP